jgi:hypothetical protein
MKHFVFFNDDYENSGGIGLKECETQQEAAGFIEERLELSQDGPFKRDVNNYTVIYGKKAALTTEEVTTKVKIEV